MVEQRRFGLYKGPYIRHADFSTNTSSMMRDFIIALLPLILFAWYKNGLSPMLKGDAGFLQMLYPLLFVILGGAFSFVIEGLYFLVFLKEKDVFSRLKTSFAVIPGILLAMVLPLNTPIWLLAMGCIFGTVIGKMIFGGFGYNIFNPALIGYLFIQTAYLGIINNNGGYLNPTEITAVTSATPLTQFFANNDYKATLSQYGGLFNFFVGTIPGSMAETSSLLCLFALVFLLYRRVINWRIPVVYIVTVFVATLLLGIKLGYGFDLQFGLFNLFSGGLMFGAVFMATEPVTTPRTPNGEIVFALFLGVVTVMLRYLVKPEGVASSILFMNLFTPLIDNIFAKVRVKDNPKKMVMSYVYVGIFVLAIFGFTLMQVGGAM